ncbi:MAG TPA: protein kinase [Kofleriaceae bacterium]|nr:protein kinase [Kofleriaceae bacterium]
MSTATPATSALVGRRLGDFELVSLLGRGGGGVVYAARQLTLAREAVVKLIEPGRGGEGAAARFLREAQLASRLDHPFAAHVYAFGAESDLLWIAFERVHGTPFDEYLAKRGPLPLPRLVPFFDRLCQVVHTAHEQGIVHRDIKPANVIVINRAGHLLPKLLDLGVARLVGQPEVASEDIDRSEVIDSARLDLTQMGDQLGTPYYMAPEQWLSPAAVDARADVYALGVLFYEALTGVRPFQGDNVLQIARAHARRALPPLAESLPPALHEVLARACAKRAAERHESALALSAALAAAAAIPEQLSDLPRLPADLLEWTRLEAPRPIADAAMALDAARGPATALDAARELGRSVAHVVGVAALGGARVVGLGDDGRAVAPAVSGEDDPDALTWWRLARAVTRPWAARPELFPLPAVVELCWHRDGSAADAAAWGALEALAPVAVDAAAVRGAPGPPPAATDRQAGARELERAVRAAADLVRAIAPLADHRLGVGRGDHVEDWRGARGAHRAALPSAQAIEPGQVVLLGPDGALHLTLSPLAQASPPTPGAPDELFLVSGRGRTAARLRARPVGYERSDPDLGPLLARELGVEGFAPAAAGADERSPYAGLSPFTAADADRFVGREAEAEALANRLRVTRFVAVVGASGAGKSSMVQAGVLPLLPGDWRAVVTRPGIAPVANLVAALAEHGLPITVDGDAPAARLGAAIRDGAEAAGGVLLLVIDQFEEVLTLTHDRAESERYAAALIDACGGERGAVRVVVTLRDDFLVRVGGLAALHGRVARDLELVTTPPREQLCRILREPARRAGYQLEEDGLVEEMVDAVSDQPGALALLSFTASRLWDLRDRQARRLTRKAYIALGAVGGALAQHAEQTLEAIAAEDQPAVREAFRHLVTSDGTRAVLRRDELTQILPPARGERVIEHLINARLLVGSEAAGGEQVEIIHEALLASWPRLVRWRLEDAESVRLREQLRSAARQWHERGRQRGLLWRGDALVELRAWRRRFAPSLTTTESAFTAASDSAEARATRIRRGILAAVGGGLTIALVVFYRLNVRAEESATRARASAVEVTRQIRALRIEQGRKEWLEDRPLQAVAYLNAGLGDDPPPPWLRFLADLALEGMRAQKAVLEHDGRVSVVRWTADGERIVTGDAGGALRLWTREGVLLARAALGQPVADIQLAADGAEALVRLHGGKRALVVSTSDVAIRRELHLDGDEVITAIAVDGDAAWIAGARGQVARHDGSGARTARVTGDPAPVVQLLAAAGGMLAVSNGDTAVLWDASGKRRAALTGLGAGTVAVAIAGDRVAIGSADGGVRIHDLRRGGAPLVVAHGHHRPVLSLAASPDGAMFASTSEDSRLLVWRSSDGALLAGHEAHRGGARALVWRGDRIYSGGQDNAVKIWRPLVGLAARLDGHQGLLRMIDVAPEGGEVATASSDRTARVWQAPRERVRVTTIGSPSRGVAFMPDGQHVVAAAEDGLHRFDSEGRQTDHWRATVLRDVAVSPDGARIAAGGADGSIHWFDPTGAAPEVAVPGHEGEVVRVAFTLDGAALVSTGEDGAVVWWDPATRARVRTEHHEDAVYGLSAGPGATVWTGGDDRHAYRWERGAQAPRAAAVLPEAINLIAPARDGARVMVGLEDGSSWLYTASLDRQLHALGGRGPNVWHGAFSADDTLAVLVGFDGVLGVHEVGAGRLVAAMPLFTSRAARVAFSPRGDVLAVVGMTGELALVSWPVDRNGERVPDLSCRTPFVVDGSALRELPRAPACR